MRSRRPGPFEHTLAQGVLHSAADTGDLARALHGHRRQWTGVFKTRACAQRALLRPRKEVGVVPLPRVACPRVGGGSYRLAAPVRVSSNSWHERAAFPSGEGYPPCSSQQADPTVERICVSNKWRVPRRVAGGFCSLGRRSQRRHGTGKVTHERWTTHWSPVDCEKSGAARANSSFGSTHTVGGW